LLAITAKIIRHWIKYHMAYPIDRIIGVESGGNPNARNPNSSATGLGQFIEQTWLDTLSRHKPELITGKSREELLALRSDPALSREMTAAHASDNAGILAGAGLPTSPGAVYLAHFAGPQGAIKVLRSDPSAPVGSVLGDAAVNANPFLRGMTAGDLQQWANRKMGGPAAPTAQRPAPQAATTAPSMQATPQAAPSFWSTLPAEQPMQQPQMPQGLPPMPRPQINLARVFANFQPRPSSRGFA
jgi:hypothetical protein